MNFLFGILLMVFFSCATDSGFGKIEKLDEEKVKKAFCKKEGWDYEKMKRDVCVQIPSKFPHVAAIGTFAHDRGCMHETYYFGGEYTTFSKMTMKALNHYGWGKDGKDEELLMNWVQDIFLVWESPVTSKPEGFSDSEFQKPTITKSGPTYTVTLWVQKPAGMLNQSNYYKLEVIFNTKAEFVSSKKVGSKTVPGE